MAEQSVKKFHSHGIIGLFARHKVAYNLVMLIMILAGVVALLKLNVQFFPNFQLDYASVRVSWPGANAEDVERSITTPIERALKTVDNVDEMTSTSSLGSSLVMLKFKPDTDMVQAVDQIRQKVAELRNLPSDALKPVVERLTRYEPVAKLLVIAEDGDLKTLRHWVRQFEQQLLDRGVDRIQFNGLPKQEMAIEIPEENLQAFQLTPDKVKTQVAQNSVDLPSGTVGDEDSVRDLRAVTQGRSALDFAKMPVVQNDKLSLPLEEIGDAQLRSVKNAPIIQVEGHPAIEMQLQRAENGDTLKASQIMDAWLKDVRPTLPPSIKLKVYDETWSLVKQRIMLLVNNGVGGLLLVVLILYIFLNGRVAFWVAVGIPVSFMMTLMILYLAGGSINMVSMFGLIMALGIIVDDAIVVGEDALAHHEMGEPPLQAAEGGAHRMLAPVTASSLTTVAAFFPLMMIGGEMGNILFAIPLVVIAVIFASLLESFLVLPGHLKGALARVTPPKPTSFRAKLEAAIDRFRFGYFRQVVRWSLQNRAVVLATTLGLMIFSIGLLAGGRLAFVFFPSPESTKVSAYIQFVSGTPAEKVEQFTQTVYQALRKTEQELEPGMVKVAVVQFHKGAEATGAVHGGVKVELVEPDHRKTRNAAFIQRWYQNIPSAAGLESLTIVESKAGPPGSDIDVQLTGAAPQQLKQAAIDLQQVLQDIPGVSSIHDDLPYGRDQLIYHLTPAGRSLGFTYQSLGQQLAQRFSSGLIQIYTEGEDEIEVRVSLPQSEQAHLANLQKVRVTAPNGQQVPLASIVTWQTQRGFDVVRHYNGHLSVTVNADVDRNVNNAQRILQTLAQTTLPQLAEKYGIKYSFEGTSKRQKETFHDMLIGLVVGLSLIYIVLAWVFASYGWPLIVMAAIPFGLIGAIMGHWWMGLDLTLLSLFGFFGLSGIVVNDSIILVSFYKRLREEGMGVMEALEEASVQRVRAVLLTSLTTIAGLTPLLFETSLQAQFLIPMAAAIAFGLMFSTLLILLVIPVLLSFYERAKAAF
ncbi:efflux RND transporter permease subunit [Galenea microaerophila]